MRRIKQAMELSGGLLMYVTTPLRVLLAHPGGHYWRGKDLGAWSIPKGLVDPDEEPLDAAKREFMEETALAPRPPFLELTPLKQKSGKLIRCWAFEGQAQDTFAPGASTFEVEWPSKSGKRARFPEIDALQLFTVDEALTKILPGQSGFVRELKARLNL